MVLATAGVTGMMALATHHFDRLTGGCCFHRFGLSRGVRGFVNLFVQQAEKLNFGRCAISFRRPTCVQALMFDWPGGTSASAADSRRRTGLETTKRLIVICKLPRFFLTPDFPLLHGASWRRSSFLFVYCEVEGHMESGTDLYCMLPDGQLVEYILEGIDAEMATGTSAQPTVILFDIGGVVVSRPFPLAPFLYILFFLSSS